MRWCGLTHDSVRVVTEERHKPGAVPYDPFCQADPVGKGTDLVPFLGCEGMPALREPAPGRNPFRFAFAVLLVLAFALTGCAPEDLPESSPQGGTSTETPLDNQLNPSQLPDSSFIYDATISSLEKADSYMDGQTVQVVGEAVGDRVLSESTPDHCWITLEAVDGTYAEVAVYMTERASEAIDTYGAYSRTGTTLQVRGTFNLACDDHEGVSDLHAANVTVVAKGHGNATPFNMGQVVPGLVLVLIGVGLMIGFRRLREHEL